MSLYSFEEALEKRLKDFATYMVSFLTAMLIAKGVDETVKRHQGGRLWFVWMIAIIALVITIGFLVLITYLDPNDVPLNTPGRQRRREEVE